MRRKNGIPVRVPVIIPMHPHNMNVYEHPPLSYYRYGEYPRDISPLGAHLPLVREYEERRRGQR